MLRRAALISAFVGTVALVLPAVGAAQAVGDSVTGSGVSSGCGGTVTVDAHSGPSGENPTGTMQCGSLFSGPVTCLNVTDNVALLNVQDALFGSVGVRITDNGPSGDALEAFPSPGCPTALSSYVVFDFTGDLVVVDVKPLPTSKDQCKNGGWQAYGVFKNQGDCVSFVATGGRNQPSGH
jgi:hypothetical protein